MRNIASLLSCSEVTMEFIQCSMCRRAAAWLIDKEVFCEGHKETIIGTFGVDHFPIRRLTNEDEAFAVSF
jgi:hypothetical protein